MCHTLFLSATDYGLAPQAPSKNSFLQTAGLHSCCSAAAMAGGSIRAPPGRPAQIQGAREATSMLRAITYAPGWRWADIGPSEASVQPLRVDAKRSRPMTQLRFVGVAEQGRTAGPSTRERATPRRTYSSINNLSFIFRSRSAHLKHDGHEEHQKCQCIKDN